MVNLDSAKNTFIAESKENLKNIEEYMLKLEETPSDSELLQAIFREAHTIKGSSGMFGFDAITDFTHVFENLLDSLRKGEITVSEKLIGVCLKAHDQISMLVDCAETDGPVPVEIENKGFGIISDMITLMNKKIDGINSDKVSAQKEQKPSNQKFLESQSEPGKDILSAKDSWHISLRVKETFFKDSFDPFSFLTYMKSKGSIKSIATITEKLPVLENINPENCYLGFEVDFVPSKAIQKQDIMDVFEFIKDDADIKIFPPNTKIDEYINLIENLPEDKVRLGEILMASGTISKDELDFVLKKQQDQYPETKQIGELLLDERSVPKQVLDAALAKQEKARGEKKKTIRIDADKIDHLITLVGELVISSANVQQRASKFKDSDIADSASQMTRLVDDIRDTTMNIRMVPIGDTFSSFKRTVHDMSLLLKKNISLEIKGGDTELDKTLVEKIQDPLMHILRNSIDHGLETPELRRKKGKPEQGRILLNAYHESGSVVIEVTDDGAGLNREKIYRKGVERGLIAEGTKLSDTELWRLIFTPGFSTAENITNVSGRGVGMDVVKKNVESLRGVIDINSEFNRGTSIRIHLPLTLAIIDGFQVLIRDVPYIIPLDMVLECIDVSEELFMGSEGGNFFTLRGEVLPFLDLKQLFNIEKRDDVKENIVIVEYARKRAGLVVDSLLGELQTVIKPLGKLFSSLKWISGGTILGNGDVALILDIPRLINFVQTK